MLSLTCFSSSDVPWKGKWSYLGQQQLVSPFLAGVYVLLRLEDLHRWQYQIEQLRDENTVGMIADESILSKEWRHLDVLKSSRVEAPIEYMH